MSGRCQPRGRRPPGPSTRTRSSPRSPASAVEQSTLSTQTEGPSSQLASQGRAGVLLDRDGTIIADHGYVGSIERVELLEGAAEAIASFNRAGLPVAIVSNQAGVARGYYGIADVERVHAHISEKLTEHGAKIDLYLFCPYHPEGLIESFARHSEDRKPAPGMARAAALTLGLDLRSSWVVGDRPEDMALAHAVGAGSVWVGHGPCPLPCTASFPSLAAAANYILASHR